VRNELVGELMADRVSEKSAEEDVQFMRGGRSRGMEIEKGGR